MSCDPQIIVQGDRLLAASRDQVLLPPSHARLFEYSAATGALIELAVDGPALACSEGLHHGPLTCFTAPSPRMLVTGAADGLVRVWALSAPQRQGAHGLTLRRTLHGHQGPIRALAACSDYSLLVSGSDDQTCIVWDLVHLKVGLLVPSHSVLPHNSNRPVRLYLAFCLSCTVDSDSLCGSWDRSAAV